MKHTSGPWIVYDDSNDGKTNRIEIAARGKTVAHIYHSVPEKDLPNARLIAAAPDLLEALEFIAKQSMSMYGSYAYMIEKLQDTARAAIAKATNQPTAN